MAPLVLAFVAISLLTIGTLYAYHIYQHPPTAGWTWVSVVVGDAFTDIHTTAAILVILWWYDASHLWWLATLPVAAHLISGGPMIAGQILKKRHQDQRAEQVENTVNGQQ